MGLEQKLNLAKAVQTNTNIMAKKGEGIYLIDENGSKYMDFSASTNNLSLGHNHPTITKAIIEHLEKNIPIHLSSRYQNPLLEGYLGALSVVLPKELSVVNYKLTNGSDAVEELIKAMLKYHEYLYEQRVNILVNASAHHGQTIGVMAASPKHHGRTRWRDPLESRFIEIDNFQDLDSIEDYLKEPYIAGILIEPVLVNAGVLVPPEGYLERLRFLCDMYGKTLAFDEVQTFGWLGTYTASEFFGVVPDMVAIAKGLGNGFPVALAAMKPKYDVLDYYDTAFTNGGTPLAMSVAIAVIDELSNYMSSIPEKGELLLSGLKYIVEQHDFIRDVRGIGLIAGVEFDSPEAVSTLYDACIDKGLILRKSGLGNVLIFKPPVIVENDDIYKALDIFHESLVANYSVISIK